MEPQTGFEPAFSFQLPFSPFVAEGDTEALNGADDGNRTHDEQLGRLTLYL